MTPRTAKQPPPPSPSRPPTEKSKDAQKILSACTRFLVGDGPRRVDTLLASIPADTTMDYYGVGGAVETLETA